MPGWDDQAAPAAKRRPPPARVPCSLCGGSGGFDPETLKLTRSCVGCQGEGFHQRKPADSRIVPKKKPTRETCPEVSREKLEPVRPKGVSDAEYRALKELGWIDFAVPFRLE